MFLKRLELHGFKTFAERREIEFIPGLTAVVGPNGSGKSNLTDAVRYVLGEQSIRNLRASKLEELIFVGSPEKGVAKRCQVSAVFDNSDHQLAIDFNEVALSRTTSREGESRYSINGVDCRLRDMQELLMGSGIGPGSFYILGSREIDMVLSNDPKERRQMLEETAGTNLYKFRRREALRKLEQAQQNLRRLKDIKIELEDQLGESQKSLRRYERYRQAQVELQELEAHLAWIKYSRTRKDYLSSQSELAHMDERAAQAEQKLQDLQGKLDICQRERRVKLQERDVLQEEISDQRENISFALASQDGLNRRVIQLEDEIKLTKIRSENLRQRVEERRERLADLEEEVDRGRESLRLSQELCQNGDRLHNQLEQNKKEEKSWCQQEEEEKQKLSLGELRLQNLQSQLQSLQEEGGEGERREELAALSEAHLRAKNARDEAESKFKSQQAKLRELRQKRTNLEKSRRALKVQLGEVESLLEERSGMPLPVRTVLRWNLSGTIGTVGELIKVPHGLEVALEVALGGRINDVIVRDRQVASELVERLKKEKAGRVTFWPLDLQKHEVEPMSLPTRQGVVGFCLDLIECSAELRPVLSQMLGQIVVMKSLKDALALFDLCKGRRPHLVTLQGEYLSAMGAVTGGSLKTDRVGIFTKKHLYEDLCLQLDNLEREIENAMDMEEKETSLLHETEQTWQRCREAERIAKEKWEDVETENRRFLRQRKILQSNTDSLQREIVTLEAELDKSREKLAKIENKLPSLLVEREELEKQLTPLREAEAERENISRQLAINEHERESIRKQFEESWGDLQEVQSDQQRLEASREQALSEGSKIDGSISSRREELESLNKRLNDLNLFLEENNLSLICLKAQHEQNLLEARTLGERLSSAQANLESLKKSLKAAEDDWQKFNIVEDKFNNGDKDLDIDKAQRQREKLHDFLVNFGAVNLGARQEYEQLNGRFTQLNEQINDIEQASENLQKIIQELDQSLVKKFKDVFHKVNQTFSAIFQEIFGGGWAKLELSEDGNWLESGVEISVCPPGKKLQSLTLFSSGERALAAIAFLFALLTHKPSPIVILDELDAPLDDANVEKIAHKLLEFSKSSQFLIITHNRKMMEFAHRLYGVTSHTPGVSDLFSVELTTVRNS